MKSRKCFLPILTIILIVINLWVIINLDEMVARWVRFASMFSFFLLFTSSCFYNKRGLPVFILFLISDALLINYEDTVFNALLFVFRSAIFLALLELIFDRIRKLQTNLFQKIVFIIAIGLNVYMLYNLVEMVPRGQSYAFYDFLFYFYGISVIVCVTGAVSFSNRYANRTSIFFLGSVLAIAFSDLTYFIAYNMGFIEFALVDIVFNILGIHFLLNFMFQEKLENMETMHHISDK